ncbi:MAG: Phospholipase D precursor [Syntrophorhabdaceae bacterium PtaU1.Bin034]|nr:MAG: Phospholipase D precursor [Syntrophorhabdaceae bacterium PtaU1.Bin034]
MRKITSMLGLLVVSMVWLLAPPAQAADIILNNTRTQVLFSPNGGCTEAIIKEIDKARNEILVQAYSFTSVPIAKALLDAHKRRVRVSAILDKSQRKEKYTSATFLANARIPTFIDDAHAIAHNKVMVIDRATVITGSFNFTKAAEEKNAENLLILYSRELAKLYVDNWEKHRQHSEEYRARY